MKINQWCDKPFIGVKKETWDQRYHGLYLEGVKLSYVRISKEEAMTILKEMSLTK